MADRISRAIERYELARHRSVEWLMSLANPDGSFGPVDLPISYYRLPWALAVAGETAAAGSLLDWIRHNQFTSDGQMVGVSPLGVHDVHFASYPLALLILGAHLRQRYDITRHGLRFLRTRQNPASGGFYDAPGPPGPDAVEDIVSTAQAGMTCLLVGELDAARKAAGWFARLWALQSALPRCLYSCYSETAQLITDFPSDEAFYYVTDAQGLLQAYYNPGIAAAFLARAYLATGEQDYLDLARAYQEFSMNATERQFESKQVCKSGWGSAVLYEATGEAAYREWTLRLGDWFVETQLADGHWENTKHLTPNPTVADNIRITAEFVVHLDTIVHALSGSGQA